jgi:tetratricopeptide (TPR) repeat protein
VAKKKRKDSGKGKRGASRPNRGGTPPTFDPQAMKGIMRHLVPGLMRGEKESTPLEEAQELMYQAFEATGEQQVRLARKALEISRDCADAYVVLAQHAPSMEESCKLLEEGVAASQRAAGESSFRKYEGKFWDVLETRPYMRARLELARCLWSMGRREEAIEHYRQMLRLNPDDNQGLRYLLLDALLDLGLNEEAEKLLERYGDDASAEWRYGRALLAFRKEGDTEHARTLLRGAIEENTYVPDYLLGNRLLPRELPSRVGFGDEDEAVSYAAASMGAWRSSPGALAWLRKVSGTPLPAPPERSKPDWRRLKADLVELFQSGEVWQVDNRSLSLGKVEGASARAWVTLVTSRNEGSILGFEIHDSRPSADDTWELLAGAMREPRQGEPRRPGEIQVRLKTLWKSWRARLDELQIECRLVEELDHVDFVVDNLPDVQLPPGNLREGAAPALDRSQLEALPQGFDETWQADFRRLPAWIDTEEGPSRPWIGMVINRVDGTVLAHDMLAEDPPRDWLWRLVAKAIESPCVGEPRRPQAVNVRSHERLAEIAPYLQAAGIKCEVVEDFQPWDAAIDDLGQHMGGEGGMRALIDVPGIKLPQVAGFFGAAAEYYRRAPWRRVPGDTPIKIECDKFHSGPWYAVVMGQSGMTLGLAMYEDLEGLRDILSGEYSDEESARRTAAISVMYGEAFEIPVRDLDAAERHGWPVAAPEAYPSAVRVNPGGSFRPPLGWEIELLEGSLRAVPAFLEAQQGAEQTLAVPVASGELRLRLSWVKL